MPLTLTTLQDIAAFLGEDVEASSEIRINSVRTLDNMETEALTFLTTPTESRISSLEKWNDIGVLVPAKTKYTFSFPHIKVSNPRLAMARVLAEFFQPKIIPTIHESAVIAATASIGRNVHIGHFSIIGENVVVSNGTYIGNNVEIFDNVHIGEKCHLKSQSVIGQQGFGFEKDEDNNYQRIPHIGSVILKNNVEVGAHSTVAAGTITPTIIDDYTKIDDHSHVGHNCKIGKNNIIAGGAIISGSVTTDDHVWFGPNCSMMQGLNFEAGCTLGVGAVMYMNGKKDKSYGIRPALPIAST